MKLKFSLIILAGAFALTGCASDNTLKVELQPVQNDYSAEAKADKPAEPIDNKITENKMSTPTTTNEENLAAVYKGAVLKTSLGDITVDLYGDKSPSIVNNFLKLAKSGFYDGTSFHRVIKDFMIQGGDPNSKDDDWSNDGYGGPGYAIPDEFNNVKLVRGSLAMANSGPNTNGSQFFIVTAEATPWLDGKHVNFGQVIKGLDVVDKIENLPVNENDHPTTDAKIKNIELIKK